MKKFVIVDGNAIVHRAFHALPPLATKDGLVVNAVYGFCTMLFKAMRDLQPDYLAVTFDITGSTERKKIYPAYKAQRKQQPPELYAQLDIVKDIVRALGCPIYELAGVEADDVIGTIVRQIPKNVTSYIVTGDADTLQLVDQHTFVLTLRTGLSDTLIYTPELVQKKYQGLTPAQLIDYKGLRGDPSDNIPGVRGIGDKGAITLLLKYHTIENVLKHIDAITGNVQKKLQAGQEQAILSKRLATIDCQVPIKFTLADTTVRPYNSAKVIQLLQRYEFKSLIKLLPATQPTTDTPTVSSLPAAANYQLINTAAAAERLAEQLAQQPHFAFDTETTGLDTLQCNLVGFSVAWQKHRAYFVTAAFVQVFKAVFENPHIKKIGHNLKFDYRVLRSTSAITVQGLHYDTMLAAYLLRPGSRSYSLDALAFNELGHQMMSYEELVTDGKKSIPITDVPLDKLTYYAAEDADYTWQLYESSQTLIAQAKLKPVLKLEVDLIPILADMEDAGIALDIEYLAKLSTQLHSQIKKLEKKIHTLAGKEFNIASPKQLKVILFEDLKIEQKGLAKTKTGISTAAAELDKMYDLHPIIPLIGEYREVAKLASTYVDALPQLLNPKTKRLHTTYNQTIAATGRLSSINPNLQNIPIRTELGQQIRRAFIAKRGYRLISLDYSQIELRLIAHLAQDEVFITAFKNNADIHVQTAAALNNLPAEKVTKELRRAAKSVNFGILYGMGAHGLMRDAHISYNEARAYLERYFTLHPAIKQYIESTKQLAHDQGYVETLLGRKRYLPDIRSGMPMVRAAAERAAINMPVQGTAADLMKLAMLTVAQVIAQQQLPATMLLQVHDELVFEVPATAVSGVTKQLQHSMEQVYPNLVVPLKVDAKFGQNWNDVTIL